MQETEPTSTPKKVKPKTPKTANPKTANRKRTTIATPNGSVSASGWLSWPKLCLHNALCAVFICLIAGGGAFAYFSHGSDSLLPSIVVPDATALPTETGRGPLFAPFNPAPGPVAPDVVEDPDWLIATSGFCSHLDVVMKERDVEASENFVADISFNYYPQTAVKFTDFPYHKANAIEGDQNEADALVSPAWDHKNIALLEPTSTCSADQQGQQAWGISVFEVDQHRACTEGEVAWEGHPCVHYTGYVSAETSNFVNVNEALFPCQLFVDSAVGGTLSSTSNPTDGWTVVKDSDLKSEWGPGECGCPPGTPKWQREGKYGICKCGCYNDNPGDADGNVFLKKNERQGWSMANIPDIMILDTTPNLCSNRKFKTRFDSSTVLQVDFDYEVAWTGSRDWWFSLWLNPGQGQSWNCGEVDMVEGLYRGVSTNYGASRDEDPPIYIAPCPPNNPPHACGDTNCCAEGSHTDPPGPKRHVTQYLGGAAGNTWSQTCDFGSSTCPLFDPSSRIQADYKNRHGPNGNFFNFRTSRIWNTYDKTWDLIADLHNTRGPKSGHKFWVKFTNIVITPMPECGRCETWCYREPWSHREARCNWSGCNGCHECCTRCTPAGSDPYRTGTHVVCCAGTTETKRDWDQNSRTRPNYRCV